MERQKYLDLSLLDILLVLFLVVATMIFNLRMIKDGINGMIDMQWHILWLQHFSKQLSEGILYPRWLSGTNYGYGSPTFVFYPPLTYYIGSLIKATGLNIENTLIFSYSLALFLSGFNCYLFCRSRWGKIAGFCGALAYMSMPYLAFNLYWVSSLSVAYGIALIPLCWWLTDKSLASPKWKIGIALFWTVLALTHLPTLLLCGLVWLFYVLFLLPQYSWKNIASTFFFSGIGLGIAAFFLIPAILEQKYVDIDSMKNVIGDISNAVLGAGLPLIPQKFDFQISHIFFHQSLVVLALGLISFLCLRKQKEVFQSSIFWLIFLLALAFMMSSLSLPIWRSSSTLQKVQAPWRLLSIFSFASSALFANAVLGISNIKGKIKYVLSFILVCLLLFNFSYNYKLSKKFPTFRNPGRASLAHLETSKNALENPYSEEILDVGEYRPVLSSLEPAPDPLLAQPKVSVVEGNANITTVKWGDYQRKFNINAATPATIKIRTYYYAAWHLYVDNQSHPLQHFSDGTMAFALQPGNYNNVELRYQKTPAFKLGLTVSFVFVLVLLFSSFKLLSADR